MWGPTGITEFYKTLQKQDKASQSTSTTTKTHHTHIEEKKARKGGEILHGICDFFFLMLGKQDLHIITNGHTMVHEEACPYIGFPLNMLPWNDSVQSGHRCIPCDWQRIWLMGDGVRKDNFMYLQYVLKFLNPISFSIFKCHFRYFWNLMWTPIEITRQNAEFCSVLK